MKVKALDKVAKLLKKHELGEFLTTGKIYTVIGVELDNYRVINDCGEPTLFPNDVFEIIEHDIPSDWVVEKYLDEDGYEECYIDPPEFAAPEFYESYFDDILEAVELFESFRERNNLPKRLSYETFKEMYPDRNIFTET